MSKPVFSGLFSTGGRRNRKSYFLFHLVALAISVMWFIASTYVMTGEVMHDMRHGEIPASVWVLQIFAFLVGIPLSIVGILIMIQRCHDFNRSGWWVLLWFVPIVGFIGWIALFFIPGTRGPNKYGPDPLEPPSSSL